MDRPIRPLWPTGYKDEVQVQAFVLASDMQNDGDVLAMNGAARGTAHQRIAIPRSDRHRCASARSTVN